MFFPRIDAVWSDGLLPADYFSSLKNYRHMVLDLVDTAAVAPAERDLLADALAHRGTGAEAAPVRAVVVTEDWCGDSAVTLPYVTKLCESAGVEIRIFRQSVFTDLKGWYVAQGTDHIPVVSLIQGEEELVRWVERPEAAHGRVKEWVSAHPDFLELRSRKETDKQAAKEYFNLYAALLREMASWYRDGLWPEIARELAVDIKRGQ